MMRLDDLHQEQAAVQAQLDFYLSLEAQVKQDLCQLRAQLKRELPDKLAPLALTFEESEYFPSSGGNGLGFGSNWYVNVRVAHTQASAYINLLRFSTRRGGDGFWETDLVPYPYWPDRFERFSLVFVLGEEGPGTCYYRWTQPSDNGEIISAICDIIVRRPVSGNLQPPEAVLRYEGERASRRSRSSAVLPGHQSTGVHPPTTKPSFGVVPLNPRQEEHRQRTENQSQRLEGCPASPAAATHTRSLVRS